MIKPTCGNHHGIVSTVEHGILKPWASNCWSNLQNLSTKLPHKWPRETMWQDKRWHNVQLSCGSLFSPHEIDGCQRCFFHQCILEKVPRFPFGLFEKTERCHWSFSILLHGNPLVVAQAVPVWSCSNKSASGSNKNTCGIKDNACVTKNTTCPTQNSACSKRCMRQPKQRRWQPKLTIKIY